MPPGSAGGNGIGCAAALSFSCSLLDGPVASGADGAMNTVLSEARYAWAVLFPFVRRCTFYVSHAANEEEKMDMFTLQICSRLSSTPAATLSRKWSVIWVNQHRSHYFFIHTFVLFGETLSPVISFTHQENKAACTMLFN